jgi:hypothetical protein
MWEAPLCPRIAADADGVAFAQNWYLDTKIGI